MCADPFVSDEEAVRLLVHLVETNGGSVPASRVGTLYPSHPGLKQCVGKLKEFCGKHQGSLQFVPNGGQGLLKKPAQPQLTAQEKIRTLEALAERYK